MNATTKIVSLILSILFLPSLSFAGILKTVCAIGKYRVCIEDPNASYYIKLLSGEERYLLEEIEPYELYLDENDAYSFAFQTKELSDAAAGITAKLECQDPKPGSCNGWDF